jgi:molybdopterin synthase catalytic subunit
MRISVQTDDFDLSSEILALRAKDTTIGAVVGFVGTVRDMNQGAAVSELELEHYSGMTEKALRDIVDEAHRRWDFNDALVIHRVGRLKPLDQIVLVAVASRHRGESFQACEFIVDYLKIAAPFWKKETTQQGARWVDARESDEAAMARWGIKPDADNEGTIR